MSGLLKFSLVLLASGAACTAIAIAAGNFPGYLVGLGVGGIGLLLVLITMLRRRVRRVWLRRLISILIPLIVVAAGLAWPQLRIGRRPDSGTLWQTTVAAGDARLLNGRLFLHDRYADQILDPDTGRVIVNVAAEKYGLVAGADGSFVQYGDHRIVYRGPDGGQRWQFAFADEFAADDADVLAIADGWVVVSNCRKGIAVCGITPGGEIGWTAGVGKGRTVLGTETWQRQYSGIEENNPGSNGHIKVTAAAEVVVVSEKSAASTVLSTRRRPITTLDIDPIAVGGDLVIGIDHIDGQQCRLTGHRGRQEVFHTEQLSCNDLTPYGNAVLLNRWMYFRTGDDLDRGLVVDLADGSTRRTGRITIDLNSSAPVNTSIPGDDVIVRRTGQQLTGRDPGTGHVLWTRSTDGDRPPGVGIENGAVTVLSALPDRAASLSGLDPSDSPKLIMVLDARTGQVTGQRVITGGSAGADGIWNSYGIGVGRALITINRGDAYAIGR